MRRSHRFPIEPPGDLIGVAKFADISAFAVPRRGRNADRIVTLLRQMLSSANLRNAATRSICSRWTWESFKVGNVETDPSNFTWHGAVEFARRQVALLSSTNHTSSCKPEILWNPQKTWVDLVDFVHVQTNLSALRVRLWIAVAQVVHTKFACQWSQWSLVTATATQLKVDFAYESNESIRIILHDAQKKTPKRSLSLGKWSKDNSNNNSNNNNSDDHTDQIMSWKASKASELPMGLLPRSNSARKCFFWSKARTPGASPWRDRADRA